MKAPASISVVSSFLVATFASASTLRSATTEDDATLGRPQAGVTTSKTLIGLPPFLPPHPNLSRSSAEILQLTQAGMDESVVISFIEGAGLFQLSADHIIYLNDLGVIPRVIQAMLAHDSERLGKLTQATNAANVSISAQSEQPDTREGKPASMAVAAENVAATPRDTDPKAINQIAIQPPAGVAKLDSLSSKANPLQAVPAKRRAVYPVRQPYPVELTAPIVFLDAPTF
jgi:hypothetical protein